MTATETDTDVDQNGSGPTTPLVAATPSDGIEYLPNGTVRFTIDGSPYTLSAPRIGSFREIHAHWVSLTSLAPADQLSGQIGWVKHLFNGREGSKWPGLSDKKLPDDEDGWPSWLGVATSYQLNVMSHFRDVPLARGGPVPAK